MNGKVIRHANFQSTIVNPRHVEVWLPPNYNEDSCYPVLYMPDGQNVFFKADSYLGVTWNIDEVLTKLIDSNKVPATIVVGIWNDGEKRWSDYLPERPYTQLPDEPKSKIIQYLNNYPVLSDNYLKFLVTELKPFIDQTYPTLPEQKHTATMGSSMGAFISVYAVCEYPDVFSKAGCLSTNWIALPDVMAQYLQKNLPSPGQHRFYFDHGTLGLDSFYEPHQIQVDKIMAQVGYTQDVDWMSRKFEGADHNEISWRERIHIPLEFLLRGN